MVGKNGGRATIRSIAEETGYSIATVSRALQESPSVRAATIDAVLTAAERLGYRRNAAGAGLRTGRTDTICMVMPMARPGDMLGDIGSLRLVTGANQRLAGSGYTLSLVPFTPGDDQLETTVGVVRRGNLDGIVLSSIKPEDRRVQFLERQGVPFVTFGRTAPPVAHAFYDVDNEDFAYRAARHLLSLGCRSLVMFAPRRDFSFARHRIGGLRQALDEEGLPFDDEMILPEANDLSVIDGAMRDCEAKRPDGYICGGEVGALAVVRALQRSGRRVGGDVHVATMETSSLASLFPAPVTGFYQDLHRAGAMLADFILRRLAGTPPAALQLVETMVLRERP